jgi:ABC-type transporter Mla maintaining outer membrane lipid asymmetry ATPase subunit MlaF
VTTAILELTQVSKDYRALRPLRIERLMLNPAEHVVILGMDQIMAEVFVNLVTGAALPDRGEIKVFGQSTAAIADSTQWLSVVDRFGIVSERAVLLDGMTVIQNLAVPFTLDIEPPPDEVALRAAALANEVGLPESAWARPVGHLDTAGRSRVRLGRALALDPAVLLFEHPTAGVDQRAASALGEQIRSVASRRGAALVALSADQAFADAVAGRTLKLEAATGRLVDHRRSRWFGR